MPFPRLLRTVRARPRPSRLFLVPALVVAALLFVSTSDRGEAQSPEKGVEAPALWGSPSVDGGRCCASLAQVRENIDRLDSEIVRLMAERGRYVAEAGRFKANPAAVSAPSRVEAIIARIKGLARANGLDESVAERSYRAMIAAFEDYERAEWTRRNATGEVRPAPAAKAP